MTIEQTKQFVEGLFADKKDLAGEPYIEHIKRVANRVADYPMDISCCEWKVAVLHDVLEDTLVTERILRSLFEEEVVDAVVLLTRNRDVVYETYIDSIIASGNKMAIEVKLADLEDNMDMSRLSVIRDKDIERLKKYHSSYIKLKEALSKL